MYTGSGRDVKSLNGYAEREPFLQLRFNLIGSFRDLVKFVFIPRKDSSENPWKIRGKCQKIKLESTYFDFDKTRAAR